MAFDVLVGFCGFFLILVGLGLMCIDEVARDGGLIYGVISFVLGIILFYSGLILL